MRIVNVNPAISVNPFVTVADRALIMLSHATTKKKKKDWNENCQLTISRMTGEERHFNEDDNE
jgi:hypothetical protein